MSLTHNYVRYVRSLDPSHRCACQQHVIGKCPVCSVSPTHEESPIEPEQLSFAFTTTTSAVYTEESERHLTNG